jgi:hypothetical protein
VRTQRWRCARSSADIVVPCSPENAWALASDPLAWRLGGGLRYAFDLADLPGHAGPARICLWPAAATGNVICALFRVTVVEPGRRLVLHHSSGGPVELFFDIRVDPSRRGTRVSIEMRLHGLAFAQVAPTRQKWDRQLLVWLAGIRDVLTGQATRPVPSLTADEAVRCGYPLMADRPVTEMAVQADMPAPVDVVWDHLWDPRTQLGGSAECVAAGHVPGTPRRAAGEMQYFVYESDGVLHPSLIVVTRYDEGSAATIHAVGRGYAVDHLVEPLGGNASRVSLTHRYWDGSDPAVVRAHADSYLRQLNELIAAATSS